MKRINEYKKLFGVEKEVELNELAEGRKPEDYGVPRGS